MDMKTLLADSIKKCVQGWDKSGIYAVSLFVYDNDDNPCEPTVTLGYNTNDCFLESVSYASDKQEAKWNYAFWNNSGSPFHFSYTSLNITTKSRNKISRRTGRSLSRTLQNFAEVCNMQSFRRKLLGNIL